MALVYLDSCAIIEAREKPTLEGQAVINLIAECAGEETPFITSELSLMEVLVRPIQGLVDRRPDDEDPIRRSDHDWYEGNLVPNGLLFRTTPITRDTLIQASLIRARVASIKAPDAIHVATAYRHRCEYFVTGDGRLGRRLEQDPAWRRSNIPIRFVDLTVPALDALRLELLA